MISQAHRQCGGRALDPRFVEHALMTTVNLDDIEFTSDYFAPAELPVKMLADCAEVASKEYNSTIQTAPVIEAVIGHMKKEGHLDRCYLKGRAGDAANVILSAVGYNLHLVLACG